jgi:hypothetical protein
LNFGLGYCFVGSCIVYKLFVAKTSSIAHIASFHFQMRPASTEANRNRSLHLHHLNNPHWNPARRTTIVKASACVILRRA